ncbi:MAG TPA: hypothetical protein VEY10_12485 [Flavisolibacter sp.]|jgi:hypothetical protein|nr:hypothetical protein [Flavisolibacter sp.]
MKLFFIIGMLCINNFSSPVKEAKDKDCRANKVTKSSYKLAPSVLIVANY